MTYGSVSKVLHGPQLHVIVSYWELCRHRAQEADKVTRDNIISPRRETNNRRRIVLGSSGYVAMWQADAKIAAAVSTDLSGYIYVDW